jgi:DNA polymerase-3 subunit chi
VLIVFEPPVPAFEGRVIYMFDGGSIAEGRAAWRALDAREGLERTYWQQDERGRWAKKA